MSMNILSEDMAKVAMDIESFCQGCRLRDSKECALCERRLQERLEELDLGGRY